MGRPINGGGQCLSAAQLLTGLTSQMSQSVQTIALHLPFSGLTPSVCFNPHHDLSLQ